MFEDHHFTIAHILTHYHGLGELRHCEPNLRGYCNTSFVIQTLKEGKPTWYFLRRYKASICEEELLFEHSLIQHLSQFPELPVAELKRTREGKTYLIEPCDDPRQPPTFFAIFDYLPGEDRYTWINPHCCEAELRNAAALLARYHQAVWDFKPVGRRTEPSLQELLPLIHTNLLVFLEKPLPPELRGPIQERFPFLQAKLQQLQQTLAEPHIQAFPRIIIHHDYHPGNLRFEGEKIVGLVDFDWSKEDWRIFDLALALFYFATEWEGEADGQLRLGEVEIFLSAYQQVMQATATGHPLSNLERRSLWQFIEAANLYVLNWAILDILHKEVDTAEYATYLWHGLHAAEWLDQKQPVD
ncbi:MAG: phosphotransferase [Anaerolineales bacterium]|nr:phosphotransferase [Anaerolineales bacterium]MDW8446842.1 phosphotransferase [Anaerolineales bacterium]